MASNIGSAATITGNPQNIMIGSLSHIPYGAFAAALAPVAALGARAWLAVLLVLSLPRRVPDPRRACCRSALRVRVNRALLAQALVAAAAMVVFFFLGQPPAKVAIVVGALLLLTRRIKPERVYAEIDWALLLLFAGPVHRRRRRREGRC